MSPLLPNWDILSKPYNWVFVLFVLFLVMTIGHFFMRDTVVSGNKDASFVPYSNTGAY